MTAPALARMTVPEYLAREASGETKHEYVNGEAFAMAGGTPAHAIVSANVSAALRAALHGKGCAVASSDLRVHVKGTGLYAYPDVTVVCGTIETADEDANSVTNPKVIFEVLSEATEAHDRGAKFRHYERIESLQAYVLVTADGRRVEQFTRAGKAWLRTTADVDDGESAIEIAALGVSIDLAELRVGLELLAAPRASG